MSDKMDDIEANLMRGLDLRTDESAKHDQNRSWLEIDMTQDDVNRPSHYTSGEIEAIDAMRSAMTPEEFRGYCKGNALKYVWRERQKEGDKALRKAIWYLRMATGDDPR